MQVSSPTPKVATRESALPQCAQKRLAQLRALVDDYESVRTNLQKRMNGVMPDEVLERAEIDKRFFANNANLSYAKSLLNTVDQWLKASGALHHVVPTPLKEAPAPKKGSLIGAQWGRLENIRTEVARIKGEIVEVKRAPLPFSLIEAQLKVIVNKWASEGEPRIELDHVKGDVTVGWGFSAPKSNKVLAWIHRDAMLARLIEQTRKQADTRGNAMSPEEKATALEKLTARKFELELEEVALIDIFQEQGQADARLRLDIDPAALLGVREPKGLFRTVA